MARLETLWAPHPRVRIRRDGPPDPEGMCVLYWMQRAQRGRDNAALNLAIALGNALKLPVLTVFGLTADYPSAQRRHYRFLVDALPEIRHDLAARRVPLVVRLGAPPDVVLAVAGEVRPAAVIGDENPVRIGRLWRDRLAEELPVPFRLVDADVVVPTSHFPNEEYAARTIRPKIHRLLGEYLRPIPNPVAAVPWPHERRSLPAGEPIDPDRLLDRLAVRGVAEVPEAPAGTTAALQGLRRFLTERLGRYDTDRNEPTPTSTSELSAWLHFGHISPLTVALAVRDSGAPEPAVAAFLEQLIVRRELAINFVARNPNYDRLDGCPEWARATLRKHQDDPRPVLYSAGRLERAETHDPLWNAAQKEMVLTGRMHNYLRMYWAKKILEWSPDAVTAFGIALDLNDRYELDGRDPNGYAGVAWAIGGKHDRPWPERPIFGTIRFMSYEGTRRKFRSEAYQDRIQALERGSR